MSKMQRRKGQEFERDVCHRLIEAGYPAQRGFQFRGGGEVSDVVAEGLPYHIECKAVEALNINQAMKQSIAEAKGKTPIVVHKKSRCDILVTMRFDDWLRLVSQPSLPLKLEDTDDVL